MLPTNKRHLHRTLTLLFLLLNVLLAACSAPTARAEYVTEAPDEPIPAEVPPLPFADNPDPTQCGIPQPYGNEDPGLVTGEYQGEVVQPVVYLYDSHLRRKITGQVYPNTRVRIKLSQSNPELDYYFVETVDLEEKQSGWIPAPFLIKPDELSA